MNEQEAAQVLIDIFGSDPSTSDSLDLLQNLIPITQGNIPMAHGKRMERPSRWDDAFSNLLGRTVSDDSALGASTGGALGVLSSLIGKKSAKRSIISALIGALTGAGVGTITEGTSRYKDKRFNYDQLNYRQQHLMDPATQEFLIKLVQE